jgi:hypothetical protein
MSRRFRCAISPARCRAGSRSAPRTPPGRDLVARLAARLERRMAFDLSVSGAHLYLSIEGETLSGEIRRFETAPLE